MYCAGGVFVSGLSFRRALQKVETGAPGTTAWRMFLTKDGERVSPWHDIPLLSGGTTISPDARFNFVAEIPKGCVRVHAVIMALVPHHLTASACSQTAKLEVGDGEAHNPITHDVNKDGSVRYACVVGHGAVAWRALIELLLPRCARHYAWPSIVNYGMLAQTWEDPSHEFEGFFGRSFGLYWRRVARVYDNERHMLQGTGILWMLWRSARSRVKSATCTQCVVHAGCVLSSGLRSANTWFVCQVRVLGILGLIDEGEMDWKVICVNASDPRASELPGPHAVVFTPRCLGCDRAGGAADVTDPAFPKEEGDYVLQIREWFETYKMPDGKPRNVFAFDGQPQSAVSVCFVGCGVLSPRSCVAVLTAPWCTGVRDGCDRGDT